MTASLTKMERTSHLIAVGKDWFVHLSLTRQERYTASFFQLGCACESDRGGERKTEAAPNRREVTAETQETAVSLQSLPPFFLIPALPQRAPHTLFLILSSHRTAWPGASPSVRAHRHAHWHTNYSLEGPSYAAAIGSSLCSPRGQEQAESMRY